ncbi:MAG: dihydroorotase [Pseudonocardiales bacterium]|nr:dihydroorotase [Pseudonocardiales bacterium]
MKLLVANGSVVTLDGVQEVDVLCEDGRIVALLERGLHVEVDETLDVAGQMVFPGFIDPHVHSRDPGMTEKEDFAHSTLGALVGGVTTIIEMPNAIPPVDSVEVFHQRRAQHEQVAWVDFGLWGISVGEGNIDELRPLIEAGVAAIKIFCGYALRRDTRQLVYNIDDEPVENLLMPPDNGVVLRVFREVAQAGGLLAAHCEDRDILTVSERALAHPVETYDDLLAARPDIAESTSIAVAAEFARATGCRFHVVHMASAKGVDTVRNAQTRGIGVTAETCPQYLTLTDEDYGRVGPMMKVYPPIRTAQDQESLWAAVADGTIVSIGSDHAPHTVEEKARGFATQPAGAVGCETFGPVMADALFRGKISVERFAEVMSTSTAKLYGLYPRKGVIRPGSDADLTIVDPRASRVVRNEDLVAKQPVSPWNGFSLTGLPTAVVLRGRVAMRNGAPVGEHRGQFVPARHAQVVTSSR